jgi:hypothetical protein
MADEINVKPDVLNLGLYAGDGVSFRIICKTPAGAPVDLNGTVKAQIRLERLTPDPPILEFSSNMVDAFKGVVTLSLTGAQTQQLITHPSAKAGTFTGVWDTQWTPSNNQPVTLVQGKVECVADVTR